MRPFTGWPSSRWDGTRGLDHPTPRRRPTGDAGCRWSAGGSPVASVGRASAASGCAALVEIATGLLFAELYLIEVDHDTPRWLMGLAVMPAPAFLADNVALVLHLRYAAHLLLVTVMLVASIIDYDEQLIPDALTVFGTLAALVLAALVPWSLLSAGDWLLNGARAVEFITLAAPLNWPAEMDGWPQTLGLEVALACWTLWYFALLPRQWNLRRGWGAALAIFWRRLRRDRSTYALTAMWLVGGAAIASAAWLAPLASWAALLSALVGMAVGASLVWAVRIVGGAALQREAMGFGDVTLLAMIGAFLGWQAAMVVFFLAPVAGAAIGIAQLFFRGGHEVPYGPFLCLAALVTIIGWPAIWDRTYEIFATAPLLAALMAACMILMGLMLWAYQRLRNRFAASGSKGS